MMYSFCSYSVQKLTEIYLNNKVQVTIACASQAPCNSDVS